MTLGSHAYSHTTIKVSREGFLKEEFSDAFLQTISSLFLFLPCSCVELQCDLSKVPSSAFFPNKRGK